MSERPFIDHTLVEQGNELREQRLNEEAVERKKSEDQAAAEKAAEAQRIAEQKDPHGAKDPSQFGLGENLTELKNAVLGGTRDTVSSFATATERGIDMASGAMVKEIEETGDYEPDFNPLGGDLNPITKTWWGNFIRTGVHFGTMAVPIVGWGSALAKGTGALSAIAKGTVMSSNWIVKGASIGAVQDIFSEYSQDANGLQVVRDRFGFIDTPCTTNDSDHPALKTVKSVCEGVGLGIPIEGTFRAIGKVRNQKGKVNNPTKDVLTNIDKLESAAIFKAEQTAKALVSKNLRAKTIQKLYNKGIDFNKLDPDQQMLEMLKVQKADRSRRFSTWTPDFEDNLQRAERKITEAADSIQKQTLEKGEVELNEPGFRAHKNKPIAEHWQGAPNSLGSAWDIAKTLKRITLEWGSELGSTESLVTPAAAESLANTGSKLKGINKIIAKELRNDARFVELEKALKAQGKGLHDVYSDAFERMKDTIGGRDAAQLETDEFWRSFLESIDDPDQWSLEEILAADLIQQSLFKQLRDRGIASRELINVTNIDDVDGPLKYLKDNLIVGLEQIERSRFLMSQPYRDLISQPGGKKLAEQVLTDLHAQVKGRVSMMFDVARDAPSDDLLRAMLEAFSMSNKISNWQDFDSYMRHRLIGHTSADGVRQTGAIVKELQGVMINSMLSSPKTPIRAILGTSTATFLRPIAQTLGGAGRYITTGFTDDAVLREGLAELNAMIHTVPEAFEYFKHRLNGYWTGELATVKSRYAEYTMDDQQWDLMRYWAEESGRASDGEIGAFRVTNLARASNHSNFFNYNMKLLAATDDAFTMILGRARARSKALRGAMEAKADGLIPDISHELIREYETRFQNEIFDPNTGAINDSMLSYARGEVTLTKDLTGFGKSLNELFTTYPQLKPFYMFARTGINGLELTMKHTPGFNFLVREFNDIARATPDDLTNVVKYGIENAQDLANAQALQNGRLAIGGSIMFMAGQKYLSGELTGNGPADIRLRKVWEAGGWKPRSIKLGGIWVGHEALEPFTSILSGIADLGDNMNTIGTDAVERGLLSHTLALSKGMVTKTYLQGLTGLTDLFGNNPKKLERIAANIMNNVVPYAGLRNEIGKFINPHMKELNSGLWQTIRNRNQFLEGIAGQDGELPVKYDVLTGQPIRDWHPVVRFFNGISPVQLNFEEHGYSKDEWKESQIGRATLFKSQFDLNLATLTAPDGTSLAEVPRVRSKFQRLIGNQRIDLQLAKLSKKKKFIESMNQMEQDIRDGLHRRPPGINPMDYPHNKMIRNLFNTAKRKAWAGLETDPDVLRLVDSRQKARASVYNRVDNPVRSRTQFEEANQLLKMTNR